MENQTENSLQYLEENLSRVKERIRQACIASGRKDEPLLVSAVKYASSEEIDELFRLGERHMGENRVNTFLEHYESVKSKGITWHFIGSLQKNKVKYLVGKITLLHSLDSLSLAEEIEKRYAKADLTLDCLVEINIANEESKGGVAPEELNRFLESLLSFPHINIKGFMTMAPADSSEEEFSRYFGEVLSLGRYAFSEVLKKKEAPVFSIGMSRTLEAAVAAGSNVVRIGSDIFGHK